MSTETSPRRNASENGPKSSSDNKAVLAFLEKLNLETYIDNFAKNDIDVETLRELDDARLTQMGIVSVGHKVKILKAIEELKKAGDDEEKVEYVCKVIVVGDVGTGKTSLIQRYTQGVFETNYKATIGVDFCIKDLEWNSNTTISVQLWDIAGQERFANLTRMYYREAKGAFIVFDVSKEKSFQAVQKWKADIDLKVQLPNGDPIPVVLLANKADLVPPEQRKNLNFDKFCQENKFKSWFLTSALEDFGIAEASNYLVETILEKDNFSAKKSQVPQSSFPPPKEGARASRCCGNG